MTIYDILVMRCANAIILVNLRIKCNQLNPRMMNLFRFYNLNSFDLRCVQCSGAAYMIYMFISLLVRRRQETPPCTFRKNKK